MLGFPPVELDRKPKCRKFSISKAGKKEILLPVKSAAIPSCPDQV
jgi:hypothetical protein